jgi:hypothetical protein
MARRFVVSSFNKFGEFDRSIFAEASGQTELTAMQMGILLVIDQHGLISLRKLSQEMNRGS